MSVSDLERLVWLAMEATMPEGAKQHWYRHLTVLNPFLAERGKGLSSRYPHSRRQSRLSYVAGVVLMPSEMHAELMCQHTALDRFRWLWIKLEVQDRKTVTE